MENGNLKSGQDQEESQVSYRSSTANQIGYPHIENESRRLQRLKSEESSSVNNSPCLQRQHPDIMSYKKMKTLLQDSKLNSPNSSLSPEMKIVLSGVAKHKNHKQQVHALMLLNSFYARSNKQSYQDEYFIKQKANNKYDQKIISLQEVQKISLNTGIRPFYIDSLQNVSENISSPSISYGCIIDILEDNKSQRIVDDLNCIQQQLRTDFVHTASQKKQNDNTDKQLNGNTSSNTFHSQLQLDLKKLEIPLNSSPIQGRKHMKDQQDMRDMKDQKDMRDMKGQKDQKDMRDSRDMRDIKDMIDMRQTREMGLTRDPKSMRETKEKKYMRDKRDSKSMRDTQDRKDMRDSTEMKYMRDTTETKDMRNTRNTKEVRNTRKTSLESYLDSNKELNTFHLLVDSLLEDQVNNDPIQSKDTEQIVIQQNDVKQANDTIKNRGVQENNNYMPEKERQPNEFKDIQEKDQRVEQNQGSSSYRSCLEMVKDSLSGISPRFSSLQRQKIAEEEKRIQLQNQIIETRLDLPPSPRNFNDISQNSFPHPQINTPHSYYYNKQTSPQNSHSNFYNRTNQVNQEQFLNRNTLQNPINYLNQSRDNCSGSLKRTNITSSTFKTALNQHSPYKVSCFAYKSKQQQKQLQPNSQIKEKVRSGIEKHAFSPKKYTSITKSRCTSFKNDKTNPKDFKPLKQDALQKSRCEEQYDLSESKQDMRYIYYRKEQTYQNDGKFRSYQSSPLQNRKFELKLEDLHSTQILSDEYLQNISNQRTNPSRSPSYLRPTLSSSQNVRQKIITTPKKNLIF